MGSALAQEHRGLANRIQIDSIHIGGQVAISSCWPYLSLEAGSWGGEFNPEFGPQKGDVVIKEHWAQSGFANTDLDLQLKQHGIQKNVLVGLVANS